MANVNMRRTTSRLVRVLVLAGAAFLAIPAQAANYALELVSPRAAGSAPASGMPAISANNRIFWAYPGLEYNIRAMVIGGAYPYTYSISNAPSGMTINAQTGEISWPNPAGASASPRIAVTDTEGVTVSSTWTISVDASRFIFIDAVNGREFDAATPGTGTLANPFRRIRDLYSGNDYDSKRDNRHAHRIAYFRDGTYYMDGFVENADGLNGGRMPVLDGIKPVAWIAYPGHEPVIDGRCRALSPQIGSRPCNYGVHIAFYATANNTYIDGFRIINTAVHGFRVAGSGNYQVFRRNRFSVNGPAPEGVNQSFIATMAGESGYYLTIQDNIFEDNEQGSCVKLYDTYRVMIEDNVCRNVRGGESEGFAIKGGQMDRVTVRHNIVENVFQHGIGGNQHTLFSGEILFNMVSSSGDSAVEINQDGVAGRIYIERNTFIGRVRVRSTDSADGPFYFRNNVIVNGDSGTHVRFDNVTDTSRVVFSDNLTGTLSQGVVDSSGMLTAAFDEYRGLRGWETGNAVARPSPPESLRVE